MKLFFGADIAPTESNRMLFSSGQIDELISKELFHKLETESDFTFLNLEAPLCYQKTPITKCGPCLSADVSTINAIKKIPNLCVGLANNHILDQGEDGLKTTMCILDECGIAFSGIGEDISSAKKVSFFSIGDKRIGLYCCAEHEFSVATRNSAGANAFMPELDYEKIKEAEGECDYLAVMFHGGKEYYRYPTPMLQHYCRLFIDAGADLVIVQHTHCVGCYEEYNGGTIVYGQGNFLFDGNSDEYWNSGLLVEVDFSENCQKADFIPLCKENGCIHIANAEEGAQIMEPFFARSKEIQEDGCVEKRFQKFADENRDLYLRIALGSLGTRNVAFRAMNRLSNKTLSRKMYAKSNLLSLLNVIECEAHREVFVSMLKSAIYGR